MAVVAARTVVLLIFLSVLWSPAGGGGDETCNFNTSCILTCREEVDNASVIHWHYVSKGDKFVVHSHFNGKDNLEHQKHRYKNRTSLVEDRNTKRRTSLQLMKVQIQDKGAYECYTSNDINNIKWDVKLDVNAPVVSVRIIREGNSTTCSSEGIYPEPQLTWSTEPPSKVTHQDDPTVLITEDQLYNITSSRRLSEGDESLIYSCNVSTRSNWRKVTLRQYSCNETHISIPCGASNTSLQGFSLIWRFNHSDIIVNWHLQNATYNVSDQWKQHVESVSQSGDLILQNLTSTQQGIYTCDLRQAGNGLITENHIHIRLPKTHRENEASNWKKVVGIVAAAIGAPILFAVIWYIFCRARSNTEENSSTNRAPRVSYSRQSSEPEPPSSPEATALV